MVESWVEEDVTQTVVEEENDKHRLMTMGTQNSSLEPATVSAAMAGEGEMPRKIQTTNSSLEVEGAATATTQTHVEGRRGTQKTRRIQDFLEGFLETTMQIAIRDIILGSAKGDTTQDSIKDLGTTQDSIKDRDTTQDSIRDQETTTTKYSQEIVNVPIYPS